MAKECSVFFKIIIKTYNTLIAVKDNTVPEMGIEKEITKFVVRVTKRFFERVVVVKGVRKDYVKLKDNVDQLVSSLISFCMKP